MSFKSVSNVFANKDKAQDVSLLKGSLGLSGTNVIDNTMIPLFSDPACTQEVDGAFIAFFGTYLTIGSKMTVVENGFLSLGDICVEYKNAGASNSVYFEAGKTFEFSTNLLGANNKAGNILKIAVDASGELRTVTFPNSTDAAGVLTKKTYYYRRSTFDKYPGYFITNTV